MIKVVLSWLNHVHHTWSIWTRSVSDANLKSDRSLCPIAKMFFGDKGNESDSSAEDADSAVIAYVVNGSSSETPVIRECPSQPSRLVAFIYAEQRRDGRGRRSELEYVRQLWRSQTNLRRMSHARSRRCLRLTHQIT